ncbi:acetate/propionate family kinase [Actinospica robiniae]|uniref:acetate/propionate family kinase n=1 Tax=Actinospica robiniae TaxID=304901 RepID=UPI0004043CC8|nr:acetate kinase [Actinospica robiniae]
MTQAVLVLNVGSSSIKYQLLALDDAGEGDRLATGSVDRIGEKGPGTLRHRPADASAWERTEVFASHEQALDSVLEAFRSAGPGLDAAELTAIGHRVVHGGSRFTEATVLDDDVVGTLRELNPLAPLHNPPNITGIEVARKAFPGVPQVAVFDTAFHQSLPPSAYTYAVPREWRERYSVRRYGFHGTSHAYVSRRAAAFLGQTVEETNVIVLHLGNGASVCAVEGGRSVETSMGLTPLEGLVMGTRSGDLDPAVPAYLQRVAGLDAEAVDRELNRSSGLLGLAGSNDLRDVQKAAEAGDPDARLAHEVYCHRIRKYIGAYYAVLGRVDAVVFTAGVGENDERTRVLSTQGLERLGIRVDPVRNAAAERGERAVSAPGAQVPVLVIPTDEEIEIARQTLAALA